LNTPSLRSFRLKNFKAIRDSGLLRFTPLTVFIGNNGSGKSSITEGLEMLHTIVTDDLDTALRPWHDFSHILNKAVLHNLRESSKPGLRPYHANPMRFDLQSRLDNKMDTAYTYNLEITDGASHDDLFIQQETLRQKGHNVPTINFTRDNVGRVTGNYVIDEKENVVNAELQEGDSLLNLSRLSFPYDIPLRTFIQNWQFVSLVPQNMGEPKRQRRAGGRVKLEKDGSNITEYLSEIRSLDTTVFDGIINRLQDVLPYSQDLQISLTSELERSLYLQLTEGNFKIPGWLFSTGTLRILALLALLHHPEPPPLIIVEEIENGLDPQSVHLIVDEIRNAVEDGRTQIIMTTHSPFLLDLLLLDHIVLVERVNGNPIFTRPGDNQELQQWAESFSAGKLYTMGRLSKQGTK
jgi:predicted ATPase